MTSNDTPLFFGNEATGIGSVPFRSASDACREIFANFPSIPFWPQLPRRSFLEHMYVQYAEGMPGAVIDDAAKTIHIDSAAAKAGLEELFEKYLQGDSDYFKISPDRAAGLYEFLKMLPSSDSQAAYVKGHVTGPVSFALSVTDSDKRSIIYDPDLIEAVTKTIAMKAIWQIRKLREVSKRRVIIFIDEPYLVSLGSSYVTIDAVGAMRRIDEVVDAIKGEGALAGLHCCGNTDWPMLLKRGIDIINFDAYNFINEFSLYGAEIEGFLKRGSAIAWGIVPSSEKACIETVQALSEKLKAAQKRISLEGRPVSSLITPSCGVGTLTEADARAVFALTKALREAL